MSTPQPDPFCATTFWQLSFREAFDSARNVIVHEADDGLIQFARHQLARNGGAVLGPIERHWMFGCNLLGPAALDLLAQTLSSMRTGAKEPHWPLVISGLEPQGATIVALTARFRSRFEFRRISKGVQCAASLEGGFDGFLSRRSANQRRNMRRQAKRAEALAIAFERHAPASPDEAGRVFDRMLEVERRSWKGIGDVGMDSPGTREFYQTMLRRLSVAKAGRVIFATHEGRDVGYIFGGVAGDLYRGQQFSFDADYAQYGVGNLMQSEQIRWLCEEAVVRYDMGPLLGPGMAYKQHWTEVELPIEAWIMMPY